MFTLFILNCSFVPRFPSQEIRMQMLYCPFIKYICWIFSVFIWILLIMLPSLRYHKSNYINYFYCITCFFSLPEQRVSSELMKRNIKLNLFYFFTKLTEQCEISRTFTLALSRHKVINILLEVSLNSPVSIKQYESKVWPHRHTQTSR